MSFARLVIVTLITCSAAQTACAQSAGVAWETDLGRAKQAAQSSGKLLLLHFWTDNCGPCKRLDSTVYNQPSVATALNQHFVPVKLHNKTSPATTQALGINRYPTDVVMTSNGEVLAKLGCSPAPMEYVARLTQVATAHASKAGAAFQLAAANSPYGPVVNQAYANLAAKVETPPIVSAPPSTPPSASAPAATNRYQVPTDEAQRPAPSVKSNPYAALANSAQAQAAAPATNDTPPIASAPTPPKQPAANVAAQVPAGSPPLGFDGYCPVTMKKQWQWIKGDPQFGVIHRGKTYLFSGAAEKDLFFKNPDAYAPVLSGVDPVVALEQGRAVPGQRQFALEYEGQFYLFSSEQTLNKFWSESDRYANGVRQAMAGSSARMIR